MWKMEHLTLWQDRLHDGLLSVSISYIIICCYIGVWDTDVCQTSALNEGNTNGSPFYKTSFTQFGHFGLLLVR